MPDPEKPVGKTVTLSEAELKAMLHEAATAGATQAMESGGGIGAPRLLKRVTERRVDVRRIDGKVVLGYRNRGSDARPIYVYEKTNPRDPTQKVLYVDLILEGGKPGESLSVDYKEFRTDSERVTCKVVRVEEKEWTLQQGLVKRKEVDGYSSVELDFDVPVDIVGKVRQYVVQIPDQDHREVMVHENYVNIA